VERDKTRRRTPRAKGAIAMHESSENGATRREFIENTGKVAGVAALAGMLPVGVHASPSADKIKVGLVGCGGRGTGAAMQALSADPSVNLVAVGDAFKSQIDGALAALKGEASVAARVDVAADKQFVGVDCYKDVINSGIDVALLASPPGFRPREIRYAIEAGKHVFAEKPAGTDPVNARNVIESAAMAEQKKLCFVAGYCWRYDTPRREFYKRVLGGDLGEVRHVHATYITGPVKPMPPASERPAGMGDVEWQIRNWYNFVWLSGDGLVEQACHSVDKILWAFNDQPPLRCVGTGGRVNPNHEGNIFDHIDVFYEWPNGARATMAQRQINGCKSDNSDYLAGAKGYGIISGGNIAIKAGDGWAWKGNSKSMYQIEHDELFAAIKAGKTINDGKRMAISTIAGIMGRIAAYTGQEVTWQQVMESGWDLFPNPLTWETKLAIDPMAVPGKTPLK
jgi:predicted dehydrogenase